MIKFKDYLPIIIYYSLIIGSIVYTSIFPSIISSFILIISSFILPYILKYIFKIDDNLIGFFFGPGLLMLFISGTLNLLPLILSDSIIDILKLLGVSLLIMMTLYIVYSDKKSKKNSQRGTYAGFGLNKESENNLFKIINDMKIPNPVSKEDFHITLLYSKKYLPNYNPNKDFIIEAKPLKFEIFKSPENKNILVLILECHKCVERHLSLMEEHNAVYDYTEYLPHLTLSYDAKDYSLEEANSYLSEFPNILYISTEYMEELKLDWNGT